MIIKVKFGYCFEIEKTKIVAIEKTCYFLFQKYKNSQKMFQRHLFYVVVFVSST